VSVVAAFEGDPWAWAGAGLYLLGGVVLTAAFHAPRNHRLEQAGSTDYWDRFLREWVPGNHVRALASLAAGAAFVLAALDW
ncbi:anthrone oxygenase family protein, partial [Actinosynnema sp. NPDC059797]